MQMKLAQQKEKYERKLDNEREQHNKSLEFLKHQIELKDDRITLLLNALEDRSAQYKDLKQQYDDLLKQVFQNGNMLEELLKKE